MDRLGSIGHYYPYGQEKPSATTNGSEKFTGYFRDAETGMDYADQRFHNPGTGRFLTPDPYRARHHGGAHPKNPTSWNSYLYVLGDPVNSTDRRGLHVDCTGDDCDESSDCDPDADFCTTVTDDGGGGNDEVDDDDDDDDDDDSDSTTNDPTSPPCQTAILNAVNNQFGTNFTGANVQFRFPNGGAINLVITGTALTPGQFNSIQPGRYTNTAGTVSGLGPSLHITNPPAPGVFTSSNIGGVTSVTFAAHIDSAFAYNPIGAVVHFFKDVLGHATRNPCP